jgi:CRP/FNR family cyclic AMP-dependent transcriptional regulator
MSMPNFFDGAIPRQSFAAGSTIFSAGDPGSFMYIVKKGQVDILIKGKVVETLGPEQFFGEMALVEHTVRSGTAVARTDCQLAPINESQFLFMVQKTPLFSLNIMKVMSGRLRRVEKST